MDHHCQCPFGAAGKENGYRAPGTSLDYVYGRGIARFAFLFEIYVGAGVHPPGSLRRRWLASDASGAQSDVDLAQVGRHCFPAFNPTSADAYERTVDTWSRAYGDLARAISADVGEGP